MPKAGLGNQLFPLMKAVILQQITGLPLMITNYHQFLIGPYMRREKSKRRYTGYFIFQKNIVLYWIDKCKLLFYSDYLVVNEPPLNKNELYADDKCIYMYTAMPHWDDYFMGLKDHRDKVIASFFKLLAPAILRQIDAQPPPCIGVHIRMGDFRKLQAGADFAASGHTRTPEHYFISIIEGVRQIAGKNLAVTVFTDGYKHEFKYLFDMPAVVMAENNPDIVDMVLLSKSKFIITSASSTFSYWAGFLSDAPLIMHPDHIHQPLRPVQVKNELYEGPFDENNPLLVKNIISIHE